MNFFLTKSQKTSYLKNCKILSSSIQRQDSQTPKSSLKNSNNKIDIFKPLEFFNIKVFCENLGENHKTSDLENYKDLSSHKGRQNLQRLRVLGQILTTEMVISSCVKFFYI